MQQRIWSGFVALCLFGCAGAPPAAQPTGEVAIGDPAAQPGPASPSRSGAECERVDALRGDRAFERAQGFIQSMAREEHPSKAAWDQGMADLEEAARNGNLQAQTRFGTLLVGVSFTDHAPEPADRDDYVKGLTYLRIAALRGDPSPLSVSDKLVAVDMRQGLDPDELLGQLPAAWLEAANAQAGAWLDCAPKEMRAAPGLPR